MEFSLALLIWIPILAALFGPALLIILSKRATARRKLLWLGVMVAGYVVGEVLAGYYARGRVNPLHPEPAELLAAMLVELSSTITFVWLAYVGFLIHTRKPGTQPIREKP